MSKRSLYTFLLPSFAGIILVFAAFALFFIPSLESSYYQQKQKHCQDLTLMAHNLVQWFYGQQIAGLLSEDEAKQRAVEAIQSIKYGKDNKDYFWISSLDLLMIAHPYRPDLIGQDLSDFADPNGRRLFVDFAEIARSQGEGFLEYLWQWNEDEDQIIPKISYVKLFKPWGWIIGTGVYLQDIQSEIAGYKRTVFLSVFCLLSLLLAWYFFVQWHAWATEKKQFDSEFARKISEYNYQIIFESASDPILIIDPASRRIVNANKRAVGMYGYSEEELLAKTIDDISADPTEENHTLSSRYIQNALEGHLQVFEREERGKHGELLQVEISLRVLELGETNQLISIIRDISERKQAQNEKERLQRQLLQAQKLQAIGTLAGGIAHDFNNILTGIMGYTELALMEPHPPDSSVLEKLGHVMEGSKRARELVKQILTFSHQTNPQKGPVQLTPIIKETVKMMRATLPATIAIQQRYDAKHDWVVADATNIHQVIMNLCTNAAQAMQDHGGVLSIVLQNVHMPDASLSHHANVPPGQCVFLAVQDTGCGIEPANLDQIFDPFFTTKEVGQGTGMGLSMVHGIVTDIGGTISVASAVNEGSTFEIVLPAYQSGVVRELVANPAILEGRERILMIDDEPMIVDSMKSILETVGYTVDAQYESIHALSCFEKNPQDYDLIISDLTMPNMNGLEFIQRVKQIRGDIPVLLSSGYHTSIQPENLERLGVDGVVAKPYDKQQLTEMIRRILDRFRSPIA